MAQSKPDPSRTKDETTQAQTLFPANEAMGAQMTGLLETQQRFVKETQEFSKHWLARRQEAAESAMETARQISGAAATDPAQAMALMTEWQKQAMQRLNADMEEWLSLCSRCTTPPEGSKPDS